MPLSLRYAAVSDVGRVRKENQDSGFASEHLLVVADGVGGAVRGDLASATAVAQLRRLDEPPGNDLLEALAGAIHRAHDRIAELVEEDRELEGTSTTLTAALFDGTRFGLGHVGDSRAYLLRDGELTQLTKDHTFVQTLVDEGRITEEESRTHPHRNLILRAVDGVHETEPDLFYTDAQAGDRLLLCSDGASGVLDPSRIAEVLGAGTVDLASVELVRAALDAGSSDNVTCIVADVVDDDAAADPETAAATATGPMLVGAAAEQPRARRRPFGRRSDTGEMDADEIAEHGAARADVDPEELRYAPRPPRRFGALRRLVIALVVLGLLVAAAFGAYSWTQQQYYVAASAGDVAIYQGVQADVPGVDLTSVYQRSGVALSDLPPFTARQVREAIDANDLAHARSIVDRLDQIATACRAARIQRQQEQSASASPSPSPAPSGTASGTSSGKTSSKTSSKTSDKASGKASGAGSGSAATGSGGAGSGSSSPTSSGTGGSDTTGCSDGGL